MKVGPGYTDILEGIESMIETVRRTFGLEASPRLDQPGNLPIFMVLPDSILHPPILVSI